jgi:hypothetical protein
MPLFSMSHGGGTLVALVVKRMEVPGSNPRASPSLRDLVYVCFNISHGLYIMVGARFLDLIYITLHGIYIMVGVRFLGFNI